MTRLIITQTAFTAGALAPTLRGRKQTEIYFLGCERLENVIVRPQGSALVRPGMRFVDLIHSLDGKPGVRLIDFIFNEFQRYVVCVFDHRCKIYRDGDEVLVADLALPYDYTQLADLDFVQLADTLLVVHQDFPVRQITRDPGEVWMTQEFIFECPPQFKFHPDSQTQLKLNGNLNANTSVQHIDIQAINGDRSNDVFDASQIGQRWVIAGSRVDITDVSDSQNAGGTLIETIDTSRLFSNQRVKGPDWAMQAPSPEHGYFRSIAYFQDRLCLGGLRDLPFRIWLSRTAAPFDFQVVNVAGSIDDAEPIQLPIATGRADPIRHLVAGAGGLEVYSTGAEGYIPAGPNAPLTPKTISFSGQTVFGSRPVKPVSLEAETLFVQLHEGAIRKFVYSNVQQSYSGEPITVRAANLVDDPVGLAVVPGGFGIQADFIVVVNRDGTGAIMSSEPTEQVQAWADFFSDRRMVDCKALSNRCYVATSDGGPRHWLEWLDPTAKFDAQKDSSAGFTMVRPTVWPSTDITYSFVPDGFFFERSAIDDRGVNLATGGRPLSPGIQAAVRRAVGRINALGIVTLTELPSAQASTAQIAMVSSVRLPRSVGDFFAFFPRNGNTFYSSDIAGADFGDGTLLFVQVLRALLFTLGLQRPTDPGLDTFDQTLLAGSLPLGLASYPTGPRPLDIAALAHAYGVAADPALGAGQTSWAGYQHLANRTVPLWADGYLRDPVAIDAAGNFTTPRPYATVSPGLAFQPLIRPMPPETAEGGSQASLLGLPLRAYRCHIRYLASAGVRVNGQIFRDRPFDQLPDTPPQETTRDRRVYLRGWKKDGRAAIEITREGAARFEILELRTEYGVGDG